MRVNHLAFMLKRREAVLRQNKKAAAYTTKSSGDKRPHRLLCTQRLNAFVVSRLMRLTMCYLIVKVRKLLLIHRITPWGNNIKYRTTCQE